MRKIRKVQKIFKHPKFLENTFLQAIISTLKPKNAHPTLRMLDRNQKEVNCEFF